MFATLGSATLKSGEELEAAVVTGPDADWHASLSALLSHKGDLWPWQIDQFLTSPVDAEVRHYLLVRSGRPVAHILTVSYQGVGILGHVWTEPPDRGKGAASKLLACALQDFEERDGQALFLSTAYDSTAYHIYLHHGFRSVEPESGVMAYYSTTQAQFEATYFAAGPALVEPLSWKHWATASALFTSDLPGVIRCLPAGLLGRNITEEALLNDLHHAYQFPHSEVRGTKEGRLLVLRSTTTGAVVGMAAWSQDATWPDTYTVDVYCHMNFWDHAKSLLLQIETPLSSRAIAYADSDCPQKLEALHSMGYRKIADLPQWIARDVAQTTFVDVILLQREKDYS